MLDMAEFGGGGTAYARIVIYHLPPPTNRQGACAEVEMQDRSPFVSLTGIESRCTHIIYHNTCTKQIFGIMFLVRHLDSPSGMQLVMHLMQILLQAVH